VLLQEEQARIRSAIEELIKRKGRKRRYIQVEETLIVGEVSDLIAEKEGSSRRDGETPTKRVRAKRRYGRCSKTRHNSRTYKVEIKDTDDSDDS
jgi:transketolase C-terminal domain/subunit